MGDCKWTDAEQKERDGAPARPLCIPEHGQPGLTWPGPTSYFGPMGWAWAEKFGPIDKSGRAWTKDLADLGKARPDVFWLDGLVLGRKTRPDSRARPGLGSNFLSWAFVGPARQHA
jgi:hypothetical protein